MAIIQHTKEYTAPYEVMLQLFPEQEVSDKEKQTDTWKKINMDYWYTVALSQFNQNRHKVARNYELLKGILKPEDFYEEPTVGSFVDELMKDVDLPAYVQHYPILNPPLNTMVGEMTKRPTNTRAKAFDGNSKNEQIDHFTDLFNGLVYQEARDQIQQQLLAKGTDVSNLDQFKQQVEQMTQEKIQDYMISYTSTAEKWANHTLNALRREFDMKEKSEEGFRDLLVVNDEYFHIFEDKSKTGFGVDVCNKANVWKLTTPNKKYTRDAYAAGLVELMELSELLNRIKLPLDEIEHLREQATTSFFPNARKSNLLMGKEGIDSVTYDTFDPLILKTRMEMESELNQQDRQHLDTFLGNASPNLGTFGNKFVVVTAYWLSKKKTGLVTYIDQTGVEQSDLVDETYKAGSHPQEIDLEWGYINQWYKGMKVGNDIYHVEPFELLNYCPIIGVSHEIKNTPSRSLVDLMKPFQTLYNVCMNQLFRLLEKEPGKVFLMNKRQVPLLKDGDAQDSLQIWEEEARQRGIIFIDDSPENMKSPSSFNQARDVDLTYSDQIRSRYELATQLKQECWELVGLSRQRMGSVMATETATATNTALTQSYAQTEPYFSQHEYLLNQVYQGIVDAAMHVECKKPESTLNYINDQGEAKFLEINTQLDLSLRDLKIYMTSMREDQEIFQKLQNLAEAALQQGTSLYDVATMYSTNSVREEMEVLKKVKEFKEQFDQQNQQIQQQQVQSQQQIAQQQMQQAEQHHQDDLQMKKYIVDTETSAGITEAQIKTYFQEPQEDADANGQPDLMEIVKASQAERKMIQDRDLAGLKLGLEQQKMADNRNQASKKQKLDEKKLATEKYKVDTQYKIAKENRNSKPKPPKK